MKNRKLSLEATATLLYLVSFLSLVALLFFVIDTSKLSILMVIAVAILPASLLAYLISQHITIEQRSVESQLKKLLKDSLHEIKIPIATIKANSELIRRNSDEKTTKRVERIEQSATKLQELYEELDYFFSKELAVSHKSTFRLDQLIGSVIDSLEDRLAGFEVVQNLAKITIETDSLAMKKIVENLLDNAIKYSRNENKKIEITLDQKRLTIKDHGIGMSAYELANAYERFFRSEPNRSGFGIGLDIVRAACEACGFKIEINSQQNSHTVVTIHLAGTTIDDAKLQ